MTAFVADRSPVTWFDAHPGSRDNTDYHVVPGLLTGLMNFGVHAGHDTTTYAVVWLEAPDDDGRPRLGLGTEELLVHELAHSYVNPLVRAHLAEFAESSPLLEAAAPVMAQQHYPTVEFVIDESVVRALTILYLRDEVGSAAADTYLATQLQLGFSWMLAELVEALDGLRSASGGTWNETSCSTTAGGARPRRLTTGHLHKERVRCRPPRSRSRAHRCRNRRRPDDVGKRLGGDQLLVGADDNRPPLVGS